MKPNTLDQEFGKRLYRRRKRTLQMTQQQLGAIVGIRYQQIQKYEWGAAKLTASRLSRFSRLVEVTQGYFYNGPASGTCIKPIIGQFNDAEKELLSVYGGLSPSEQYKAGLVLSLKAEEHIDLHIGKRLKQRRNILSLTQGAVGKGVGVRFQQIQKYECGLNKISANKIPLLAAALDVPVEYFFEGLEDGMMPQDSRHNFSEAQRRLVMDYRYLKPHEQVEFLSNMKKMAPLVRLTA